LGRNQRRKRESGEELSDEPSSVHNWKLNCTLVVTCQLPARPRGTCNCSLTLYTRATSLHSLNPFRPAILPIGLCFTFSRWACNPPPPPLAPVLRDCLSQARAAGNCCLKSSFTSHVARFLLMLDHLIITCTISVVADLQCQVRVGHKKENFNANCYSAYYSIATVLNELFSQISG
jgi:hypothetical protein